MTDRKRTALANWTDLQFVAEFARHGSLSATARSLGVTHATVARRIGTLDKGFGKPLFKRQDGRYVPTATGSQIVTLAQEMEEPALRVARAMAGVMPEVAGPVRVTSTAAIASTLVVELLAGLRKAHPGLEPELVASNENLSLARRDADIALRLGRPTQGDLFTRKVGDLAYYRYASRQYLKSHAEKDYRYIGYSILSTPLPEPSVLESFCKEEQIVIRTDNILVRRAAVERGAGVALLTKYLAEASKSLQKLDRSPVLVRELWLIVHRDLRDVPRIRACADYLAKNIHRALQRLS